MKKAIAIVLGMMLLLLAGCTAQNNTNTAAPGTMTNTNTTLNQKAKEGEPCSSIKICDEGLKCINSICSSGKLDSACANYKDCQSGLYCLKSICSNPPSYTQYFSKITISKMKQGIPPGPNNMPIPTTEFKTTDAIEIDISAKPGISGTLYYELINSTTGLTEFSSAGNKQKVMPGNWGTGFGIPYNITGNFDLNIYYNDVLVYTVPVTISQ